MGRHAYLIMAHGNYTQLSKLVSALDDERNDIYIHIDKKAKNFNGKMITATNSKIKFVEQINVNWGGYSIVKCELLLLEAAVKAHTDYVRYHLISGVDLPIKSQDYIHDFFENNHGEYIRFDPKPISLYEDRVKYYYPFQNIIGRNNGHFVALLYYVQNILIRIQRLIQIDRSKSINIYKGVNWFSITDDLARFVLEKKKFIQKQFKYTLAADEIFLHTVVQDSPYKDNIVNNSLRFIDWERGNPYTFTVEDYDKLIHSSDLFARKFDENKDSDIIDMILHEVSYND